LVDALLRAERSFSEGFRTQHFEHRWFIRSDVATDHRGDVEEATSSRDRFLQESRRDSKYTEMLVGERLPVLLIRGTTNGLDGFEVRFY